MERERERERGKYRHRKLSKVVIEINRKLNILYTYLLKEPRHRKMNGQREKIDI